MRSATEASSVQMRSNPLLVQIGAEFGVFLFPCLLSHSPQRAAGARRAGVDVPSCIYDQVLDRHGAALYDRKRRLRAVNLLDCERVLLVHHWTDRLFSFSVTRDAAFRFVNGQFTMIGLETEGKRLLRAYSMVSANYDDALEFLSIKVPNGPLTSRLQHLRPGDFLLVNHKPTGTLIRDNLLPGQILYLLATGTGIAPFLSIIKDPTLYESFEQIVLFHGCRRRDELGCGQRAIEALYRNILVGEMARAKLHYYPSVTREKHVNMARITDLVGSGKLFEDLRVPVMDTESSRIMLCGNPRMLEEMQILLANQGFEEGSSAKPGHYVV